MGEGPLGPLSRRAGIGGARCFYSLVCSVPKLLADCVDLVKCRCEFDGRFLNA